jgi:hypothetical protein
MFVYSVPDAVAKTLEQYKKDNEGKVSMFKESKKLEIKSEKEIKKELKNDSLDKSLKKKESVEKHQSSDSKYSNQNHYDMLPECPDCGGDLQYAEGCIMCQACGYSKCG